MPSAPPFSFNAIDPVRKRLQGVARSIIIRRMIKNVEGRHFVWLNLVITGVYGCGHAQAVEEDPLQGVVEYDDRVIGFELGGRVLEVPVDRGQILQADVLLAKLDDGLEKPQRDLRAAELSFAEAQLRLLRAGARGEELRAAEAEISALRSQEGTLEKNLARQQLLERQAALAQSVLDDTTGQLQNTQERRRALEERLKALRSGARGEEIAGAVARVQAAAAGLAAQDARLARFDLHNPAEGSVVDVHVKVGEMVAPGTPAITMADLSHPFVDVFVPEARAHSLKVGQPMQVRVDGVDKTLPGRIEHMFPRTEFTPRFLFSDAERPNLVLRTRVRIEDKTQLLHSGIPAFVQASTGDAP